MSLQRGMALLLGLVGGVSLQAQGNSYAKDVRPFLDNYCVTCHQTGNAKEGINLETFQSMMKSRRALVVPGDPDKSRIVLATEGKKGHKMPPKKAKSQPTAKEIKVLRDWIKAGAKDDSPKAGANNQPLNLPSASTVSVLQPAPYVRLLGKLDE